DHRSRCLADVRRGQRVVRGPRGDARARAPPDEPPVRSGRRRPQRRPVLAPRGPAGRPRDRGGGAMTLADAVAVVLMAGIVAYALFGGADFGAGFWDLLAGSASRGARPRAVAQHAIGPVWEANHVWLVFCLVVLWSAFPTAFSAIGSTL